MSQKQIYKDNWRDYLRLGLIPLPAPPNMKGPIIPWADFQQEPPCSDEYAEWEERFADYNIWCLLGGEYIVLDPDHPEAEQFVQSLNLPECPISISGNKSVHRWFKTSNPVEPIIIKKDKKTWLELRTGQLGMMVPPSKHPETNQPYTWEEDHSPQQIPFPELPAEVYDKIKMLSGNGSNPNPRPADWADDLLQGIPDGGRNTGLAQLAGRYISKGLSREEIFLILESVNSKSVPPKSLKEVNTILDSVFKTHQRKHPPELKMADDEKPELTDQFEPISVKELIDIFCLTIVRDEMNKVLTFLCMLSAYTEDSQFNISFNAPSSTGKSYIPLEIARLFPKEDVIELGYCSPSAFFHDYGVWDKERKVSIIDLSHKIIIFLDQPHTGLLERLRPILSHDRKEIQSKITDRKEKHGLRTKNIIIRGYPSVIFCSAGLKIDEQEGTRFLLLSPEADQEKIRQSISVKIKKEAHPKIYEETLENNPDRQLLKRRILAIKAQGIKEITLSNPEGVEEMFFKVNQYLKPRHSRDIGRVISIIKSLGLVNLWFRERNGHILTTSQEDIDEGFKIWNKIFEPQELNLPPYIFDIYIKVLLPLWKDKKDEQPFIQNPGITRQEISKRYFRTFRKPIADWVLHKQILPMLDSAGLIYQEQDATDKRKILVYSNREKDGADSEASSEGEL